MKFVSLEIENIVAYNGSWSIDLLDTDEQRSIVLIKGRNGAGKTSLLNAVKLLFLGFRDDGLRRVGFAGTALTERHYVVGQLDSLPRDTRQLQIERDLLKKANELLKNAWALICNS